MPRKPPEAQKPAEDWRRVLRVSRGKREVSTAVPATPPAWGYELEILDADGRERRTMRERR